MSKPSLQDPAQFYYANRFAGVGVLCLCVAMACFGIGAFLDSPGTPWGIFFIVMGVLWSLSANASFIYYANQIRKNRKV